MYMEVGGQHHKPHFHAYYGDDVAIYTLEPIALIAGALHGAGHRAGHHPGPARRRGCPGGHPGRGGRGAAGQCAVPQAAAPLLRQHQRLCALCDALWRAVRPGERVVPRPLRRSPGRMPVDRSARLQILAIPKAIFSFPAQAAPLGQQERRPDGGHGRHHGGAHGFPTGKGRALPSGRTCSPGARQARALTVCWARRS